MPVVFSPLSPASAQSPVESAGSAAIGTAPEDGAGSAFPRLLDEALATPADAVAPAEAKPTDPVGEAGNPDQASDSAGLFGILPGLSSGLPILPVVDSRPVLETPGADAGLHASVAGLPTTGGASAAVPVEGRHGPAAGSGASSAAEAAVEAAMDAERPAARTAAGGSRLPESSKDSSLRGESSPGGADPGAARLVATSAALAPAVGTESGMVASHAARPSTGPATVVTTVVGTPVGRPEWGGAVGERIGWLASQRVQVAELQLSPAHLGPVEVRISLDRDVATIALAAAHAPVRDALQASLPRLAEALAGSGLQLGQASVGADGFLGGSAQDRGAGRGSQEAPVPFLAPAQAEVSSRSIRMQPLAGVMARGGIDLFA